MNPVDKTLDRLLRAAAQAPPAPQDEVLPMDWENRVLSEWKRTPKDSDWTESLRVLRQGLVLASLIMLTSLLFSLTQLSGDSGDEWAYARISVSMALNQ
jgi:hypothetical protein